jgi:(+)-trans-carveol dehydrogenase
MGRVDGKVALITGAARGQGRSHALRLAEEGADIVALDITAQIGTVKPPMSSPEDLAETVKQVEELDRRILARQADVRDQGAIDAVVAEAVAEFGHIDIVAANAAIFTFGVGWEITDAEWQDIMDVNLTGVWHTLKAVAPPMIEAGRGGSIIITSSAAGLRGLTNMAAYVASKHGVVGLMRTFANELAPHRIRVNSVHPGSVATPMILNDVQAKQMRPDLEHPTRAELEDSFGGAHALPVGLLEPVDISNAVLWLASDEARYVTGVTLPVDAGLNNKWM